ncbi:MAG: hypothetical protein KF760_05555 [Candidatus Eremiobacteraeota bacterium]|nr:hypothetical protein [Candidatus Eremiobacteraeota bacterium]MCW5870047.1 hypothetical protein [Candidatus Eremiobacteraeota bacterium]
MSGQLLVLLTFLAGAGVPGWLLASALRGQLWSWNSLGLGAALGTALATTLSFITPSGAWEIGGLLYLAAAAAWAFVGKPSLRTGGGGAWPEWVVLGWLGLCEWMVVASSWWPDGWDTAFHSILAEKILLSGRISHDWMPIEAIPVNYPQGLHALTAWLSRLSEQGVPVVLQTLHFPFQMGAALATYRLGRDLYGHRGAGLAAACIYGFCGNWGTFFNYASWGGLPTEAGCWLFLELLCLSLRPNRRGALAGGLLLGAIGLCHHLSSLLAALILVCISLGLLWRKPNGWVACLRFWWSCVAVALLAFAFYWIPYLSHAGQLSTGSSALRFEDEAATIHPVSMLGWIPCLAGLAGLLLRGPKNCGTLAVKAWFFSMLFGWLGLDFVYRGVAYWWTGTAFSAFTPSRWLTIQSYPLAILGGYAVSRLGRRGLAAFCGLAMSFGFYRHYQMARPIDFPPEQLAFYKKLRELPPNTLLAFAQPPPRAHWLAYLTWHPTLTSPIPASEDRRPAIRRRQLFASYAQDRQQLEARLAGEHLTYVIIAPDGQLLR